MTISVIIPSKNRLAEVRECLAFLGRQSLKPREVVVIENNERQTYQGLRLEFPNLSLVLKLEPRAGKAAARNLGLKVAQGDILAFLDDDCQPRRDWTSQLKAAFEANPTADVILGDYQDKPRSLLNEAYNLQYKRWFFELRVDQKTGVVHCGGALNTRNCAVRRSFLSHHRLRFDRRYDQFGYAEDTDFGEQLERAGAKIIFVPQLVVAHQESANLLTLLQKKFANGRAMQLVVQKGIFHPFQKRRKNFIHKLRRAYALTQKYPLVQKLIFLFELYLIVFFYHLGFWFQAGQTILIDKPASK